MYRWCNNDIVFTKMVMDAFENPEIRILYIIPYLRGKIESVESQIKEYSTDPKKLLSVAAALEFDSQKYLEKLQKERQLYIHTLSDLENKDTKLRTLSTLQGLAYESVGQPTSFAWELIGYLEHVKSKFRDGMEFQQRLKSLKSQKS